MKCPAIACLPVPPPGKRGWPWSIETPALPEARPDGEPWPLISVIVPNLNHCEFIEETIRSILLQGYSNVELIIIDGGSTDNSLEIIKRYEPWLAYFAHEKDGGKANALNKGLAKSTGTWFHKIYAGDALGTGALEAVGNADLEADLVCGKVALVSAKTRQLLDNQNISVPQLLRSTKGWHLAGFFFRRERLNALGGYREELKWLFEFFLACTYIEDASKIAYVNRIVTSARDHSHPEPF